jgi:hypothetical protein
MNQKKVLPICLVLISVVLCLCNWKTGSWLSGWDTLHPEFNFWLYFTRTFFGVWQEHQGLGALAVQAHAADLPRMLIYWPLSVILPASSLRFAYIFLTLGVGSLGMFYFLKRIFGDKGGIASFVGSLFYLLNLGTLQLYHFPLEMFATLFTTLPWLLLFASKYLSEGQRKDLLLFLIFSFFSTPMAHTPTLFYAYLGMFILFVLFQRPWKRGLALLALTLAINSFWLLPNLYFVITDGQIVQNSKISTQFSETAFLTGKQFGNFKDTLLLKNFLFDWGKYDNSQNQFVGLFTSWKRHLENPLVASIGYLLAAASLVGTVISVKSRNKKALVILPIFLLSFLIIANNLPILSNAFAAMQEKLPLFKEALRFPFTKFSNFLFFSQAVFLAVCVDFILKRWKGRFAWAAGFLLSALIVIYMFPAFQGNFINKDMQVSFPKEYFEAMSFVSSQGEEGRAAHFPLPLFWGWNYYSWGYEGAGFWWFGLSQPLLDREFDRWSPYNEQYYWEISYAVYSQNKELFEDVLRKYNVRFLILDEQVINPSSPQATYLEELKSLFSSSFKIKLAGEFGKIKVYQYLPESSLVTLYQDLPQIGPCYSWTNYDRAYSEQGNYFSAQTNREVEGDIEVYYPFRSLFTGRSPRELDFEIWEEDQAYIFRKSMPSEISEYEIKLAEYQDELIWIDPEDPTKYQYLIPQVYKSEGLVEVIIPKVGGYFSKEVRNEFEVDLSHLLHKFGYLISVESKNLAGRSLLFWLENLSNKRANIETYLPKDEGKYYFIQPPMENFGLGYQLHFDSNQIGEQTVSNSLGRVVVNLIPFNFITGIKLVPSKDKIVEESVKEPDFKIKEINHPNPSVYKLEMGQVPERSILALSQSFHQGWHAYVLDKQYPGAVFWAPILGKEIKDKVLVNNWANGWKLNTLDYDSKVIILVFLPQYLQYLGVGLAGLAITSSLFWRVPGGQHV